jgi:hypothetical protein
MRLRASHDNADGQEVGVLRVSARQAFNNSPD